MSFFLSDLDAFSSSNFFKDSFQAGTPNVFDQALEEQSNHSGQTPFESSNFFEETPSKLGLAADCIPYSTPYFKSELTPPSSAKESPANWPLDAGPGSRTAQSSLPTIDTSTRNKARRTQFGQVTPPDDEPQVELDFPGFEQQQAQSLQPNQQPSRKRSKKASGSPKSLKGSKRAKQSLDDGTLKQGEKARPPVDQKRSMFLERNRLAAYKCRQKKKEQTKRMEDDCRELQRQKLDSIHEIEVLNKEIVGLKNILLEHARKGCEKAGTELKELYELRNEVTVPPKPTAMSTVMDDDDSGCEVDEASDHPSPDE